MSEHNAVKGGHPEGLVTSDHVQGKGRLPFKLPKWWPFAAVTLVALLVAGGTYYYLMYMRPQPSKFPAVDPHKPLAAQAQAQLSVASNPSEKAAAYETLAASYMDAHDYSKAIVAYQQALVYSPNNTGYLSELSDAYAQSGQKDNAAETLQKIVTILQASKDSKVRAMAAYYQAQIQILKGNG